MRGAATPATVVLLVAVYMTRVADCVGNRCYVCVPRHAGTASEVHRMFAGSSPLQRCEDWRPDDPRFIRECPADHLGCQTQTNGSHVTRTCGGDVSLNACNTANNINYCYCTGSLCNRPAATVPSDDEDLVVEGSGAGHPAPRATPPTTVAVGLATTPTSPSDASRHDVATLLMVVTWIVTRV